MPLTLFPNVSKSGEYVHTPITPGTTIIMPPPTPDLLGSPTAKEYYPL